MSEVRLTTGARGAWAKLIICSPWVRPMGTDVNRGSTGVCCLRRIISTRGSTRADEPGRADDGGSAEDSGRAEDEGRAEDGTLVTLADSAMTGTGVGAR
jgi:hypothetical protein